MLNNYFCDKNGLLPFDFGYVAKIENVILSSFSCQYSLVKFSVGIHIETE